MAIRTIESRLECLSVNDENEQPNAGGMYQKSKVSVPGMTVNVAHRWLGVSLNGDVYLWPWPRYSIDFEYESPQPAEAGTTK